MEMEMTKEEFEQLKLELVEDGYQGIAPEGSMIDQELIAETPCLNCKGPLIFVPFSKPASFSKPNSYRAFAVCDHCGAFEF